MKYWVQNKIFTNYLLSCDVLPIANNSDSYGGASIIYKRPMYRAKLSIGLKWNVMYPYHAELTQGPAQV